MGEDTKISWAHHTFNPWWGCTEVDGSPECDRCYAKVFACRCGFNETPVDHEKFPIWGNKNQRRFFGDKHWQEPLRWDRDAAALGERKRVFIMSMGDWAEGRPDQRIHRDRLWDLCMATPNLDKLLLTKRPQLIDKLCPFRDNPSIWQGTTAGTQKWMDLRWFHLRQSYALIYWFSMEPLFERITLPKDFLELGASGWVIVGAESGARPRPMDYEWARYVRDQCRESGIRFHFKQQCDSRGRVIPFEEIPVDLQIRESPQLRRQEAVA